MLGDDPRPSAAFGRARIFTHAQDLNTMLAHFPGLPSCLQEL